MWFFCLFVFVIYLFLLVCLCSCGSPVPVTNSNHASPEGQMVSFLLIPAFLRLLHSDAEKYESATGAEPPGVFRWLASWQGVPGLLQP